MHSQHLPRSSRGPLRALRLYRISQGWTQQELAKRLTLRQGLVSEIEIGRVNPDAALRKRIAEVFGCSSAELFPELTKGAEEEAS